MHNTYISSTVLSLGTKGSLSFSFNDFSNLLNERFDKSPLLLSSSSSSRCCSCCSCSCCASSFTTHRVPINATLLYGLRQSTLVQCSVSRRLILGGRDRYYYRVPAYGLDHGRNEVSCSFKEKGNGGKIDRRRKGTFGLTNLRERCCLGGVDDAEAVISLLSEEVSEEYLGERKRNGNLSKRVGVEKRGNYGGECHRRRERDVNLGLLESDSKCEFESNTVEWRKEGCRKKEEKDEKEEKEEREERTAISGEENHRGRKSSSSFSSYYSLSSTEDFEADKGAQDQYGDFLEESSSRYWKDLRGGENRLEGQVAEDFKKHRDVAEGHGKVSEQRTSATRAGVEWDLRKKSEKKLTESEETQSIKESSQVHSRMARTHESDYTKASSSNKRMDDKEEKNLEVNLERGMRKQYSQMGNQVREQSEYRRNYQGVADIQEMHGTNVETNSQRQDWVSGREENLTVDTDLVSERTDEHHKTVGESAGKDYLRRNTQQLTGMSEIGNVDIGRVSNLHWHSESRKKMHDEDRALSSGQETNDQWYQMGQHITGKIESRRSSQHFSEISEIHDSNSKKTSILQSGTRVKNQEGTKMVISSSGAETKEQESHTDKKDLQGIQSTKGSEDVTNISVNVTNVSVVRASNIEAGTDSHRTSEKRMIDHRSELTSAMKPIREGRERDNRTDEDVTQVKSRNEDHRATCVSSFQENASQEASTSQASLNRVSQLRGQEIHEDEGNQRSSEAIMMPPSAQLVVRDSLVVGVHAGMTIDEVSSETSESSSSVLYTNSVGRTPASHRGQYGSDRKGGIYQEPLSVLSPEDALGSAYRLEESSKQFVGEFVDKVRHEELTSEIQKEKEVSGTKLLYEGEKCRQQTSGQYGSKDLELKKQGSRQSSGGSGVKGPSDDMWAVRDPSLQEPETEALEDSTATDNIVVRKTGGSLWSIIANIVRLRWGSRAETPKSARRSGGKSSSKNSVSSEAWFSGHDPDENIDKNVERERRSMSKESTSSHQLHQRQTSSQGEGETSDTIGSKDMIRQLEVDASSPSTILKSGSTSKGISSPSEEENLGWSQDGKSFQVDTSGLEVGVSSLIQLPSSGIRSPIAEQNSGAGKTDVSVSGSMELMEHSVSANLTEGSGSEGKDVELKRRRLQRNKQVLRDRFDEWEEAYIRESEQRKIDEMFMREALLEAKKAADTWEVPVGAVLVQHGKIIARGYNLVEELRDSTAHAEMFCIREASNQLRTWRLAETTLYVTLEPCPMCAGAILQARIDSLVWGAPNKLLGADGSWIRLFPDRGGGNGSELMDKPAAPVHPFHPKIKIRRGILASECADVMQQFFQLRRKKQVKDEDAPPQPSCLPIANPQSKILSKMHDIFHAMFCL